MGANHLQAPDERLAGFLFDVGKVEEHPPRGRGGFILLHEALEKTVKVGRERPVAQAQNIHAREEFLELRFSEVVFEVGPTQAGYRLQVAHQHFSVPEFQGDGQGGGAEGEQVAGVLKLMVGRVDGVLAVEPGQAGPQSQAGGHASGVDGESAFAATLRHQLDADSAVGARDDEFAELPEAMHRHELGRALADLHDLVGLVHEAVAAEQHFAPKVLQVVAVEFHGDF